MYALLQARYAREYSGMLIDVLQSSLAPLDSLESALESKGWVDSVFSASGAQALQERVKIGGFLESEIDTMLSVGMTPAEIDSAESAIVAMDLTDMEDASYRTLIDSLRLRTEAAIDRYDSVVTDLDGVLGRLQYVWSGHPIARISGADSVGEGASLALNALASSDPQGDELSYAWDLDMDGLFDDGATSTVQYQSNHQGEFIVGLKTTDTSDLWDVSYERITVTDVNRMPQFTQTIPAEL
jgi:hypothetical protein